MSLRSLRELAELTGKNVDTVKARLDRVPFQPGPKNAKLYKSPVALERIYSNTELVDGEPITQAEATRLFTIKRGQEIDLNMEIKRKERIPLETVEEINDEVYRNLAGILKAQEGKFMSVDAINDLLAELRRKMEALREFASSHAEV